MTEAILHGSGTFRNVEAQVDPSHRALRASLRPIEVGAYGSYSMSLSSGVMAASLGANSNIFAWRWGTPGVIARITRVQITAANIALMTAAQLGQFSLFHVNSFLTNFTSTVATNVLGADQQRSSRFANTQQQSNTTTPLVAISATAALTATSVTIDDNPLSTVVFAFPATASNNLVNHLFIDPTEAGRQPLDLFMNEGFTIKSVAALGAGGTWSFSVSVDWDEIDQMRYLGQFS